MHKVDNFKEKKPPIKLPFVLDNTSFSQILLKNQGFSPEEKKQYTNLDKLINKFKHKKKKDKEKLKNLKKDLKRKLKNEKKIKAQNINFSHYLSLKGLKGNKSHRKIYFKDYLKKIKNFKISLKKKQKRRIIIKKSPLGVVHLLCNKKNIFCTLTDDKGRIKASVSTGLLKVKGKKRKSFFYVPRTGQLLVNSLFKINYRNLTIKIKGNGPKKKKKTLLNYFTRIKKFKFLAIHNLVPRSHNGCRPPKIRRK